MRREFYDRLAEPFEKNRRKRKRLILVNNVITKTLYAVYPVLLVLLAVQRDQRLIRTVLVPLISFAAVTMFRRVCNCRRPYEVWDAPPLIPKDTKGNSFPSRHVFSIYIIAMAALWICPPAGAAILVAGVFLAAVRVIARVHFVRDVVAGAALGAGLGWIGFFLIPFRG